MSKYNPINQECWKLYRENKISQNDLRIKRLVKTFEIIQFEIKSYKIEEISNLYIKHLITFKNLFDGTHELLKFLKKKYRLHVITNGFEDVQIFKIINSGLSSYFDNIFTESSLLPSSTIIISCPFLWYGLSNFSKSGIDFASL